MEISESLKKLMGLVEEGASKGAETYAKPLEETKITLSIPNWAGETAAKMIEGSSDSPGWQDQQDAARHLLGVGELARRTHPIVAKSLGALHEFLDLGSTTEDTAMDAHNNELALSLYNAKTREELEARVKKLMPQAQYRSREDKTAPTYNRR